MSGKNDLSMDSLQRSFAFNRKLFSLIQKPGSEAEVSRFVVDKLYEEFPTFRVSYAVVHPDESFSIIYSRQPADMQELTGFSAKLQDSSLAKQIQSMKVSVISDVRASDITREVAQEMKSKVGTTARIDFPFEQLENGDVGFLSLTHQQPQEWSPDIVKLLSEIGELVHLLLRDARARERLRESELLFRQMTENLPMVFWVVEIVDSIPNQRVVYVSPAYEEVWGRSTESARQDPFSFLHAIHPEDRDRIAAGVMGRRLGPYEQHYRVVRPDGSIRWVRDRGHPLFNEKGEVHRILGLAEDVTALHLAQVKLENSQAQVLSNAKLAMLGEMAGGIAHEISNPLAVINGLAQQMKELQKHGQLAEHASEKLGTIEKMSNCIAFIVKSLRAFARQSEQDPPHPAELKEILRETLVLCEAKLLQTGAQMKLDFASSPLPLKCRASEISQVILNLVNNALDAVNTSENKVITLRAFGGEGSITIEVENSGPPIEAKIRDLIFQPFFTTKEVGKGTGLGLSISKGIMESHGGKLYLDTECAHTKFVAEFPVEKK